ncbi:hypothetical protein EJ06DRAFT_525632 [Trichodelitschia bisporula]|uniref:ATPase synthesis protein 25 n=1 Tax=Trichodelitschia bisporula TaxID=703511 RepID=A0A6G1IAR2_9PEZI|nr:hypothetical protein EJ06DRAFT_525632 [Trichodelitschia bisporula]
MALRPFVSAALTCSGCRSAIMGSFVSRAGVGATHPSSHIPKRRQFASTTLRCSTEAFHTFEHEAFASPKSAAAEESSKAASEPSEAPEFVSEQSGEPPSAQVEEYVPWYLKVQQPKRTQDPAHPLADKQRLPDLPADPPPILQPVLEHMSVELGLDSLSLLDLRALDPPPGLGANLMMIVGTARSQKHLQVSADRFCRWLRATYRLRPYSDGLLGRNELKRKMRRKNKRARLLANVGAEDKASLDDGISTGWVCVHMGRTEPAESVTADVERSERVGFGFEDTQRVTLVAQIMTEEKREEIDLEDLWTTLLKRSLTKKQKLLEDIEALKAEQEKLALEVTGHSDAGTETVGSGSSRAQDVLVA